MNLADVNILHCEFGSNEGVEVIILNIRSEGGSLNIENSNFTNNKVTGASLSKRTSTGMFHVENANITTWNLTFTGNTIRWNGLFSTTGNVEFINNIYIDNSLPRITYDSPQSVRIEDCDFYGNTIIVQTFQPNIKSFTGALIGAQNVIAINSNFENNSLVPNSQFESNFASC